VTGLVGNVRFLFIFNGVSYHSCTTSLFCQVLIISETDCFSITQILIAVAILDVICSLTVTELSVFT
jgi:hypothetical protein